MEKERPPVFGMIERGGQVVINLLANVQQKTIDTSPWTGGEFARDDDGDGLCEVHVKTMAGFWSLLRSWLRPHRGMSQEKLPLYLGFFECVHNVRKRGKALLPALLELLVT